jgi:hypothetical protein
MRGKIEKRGRSSNSIGRFFSRPGGQRTHGFSLSEIFETLRKAKPNIFFAACRFQQQRETANFQAIQFFRNAATHATWILKF